ncbi:hypothetical protein ILUMI_01499 [Ignelater luminosus]|uniref:DDE-1 domain-containing protein n=1 Tax=Ignelater luminosus TaxID=2038154 RepID=A0A8K0DEA5_IGNLU|nr:hypothetical protein ILUMI_01499 [Ignelater luminosus]
MKSAVNNKLESAVYTRFVRQRSKDLAGEKFPANPESAEEFKKEFADLIALNTYNLENVYDARETGLSWKSLPRKSLVSRQEQSAADFKVNKERLTNLTCGNITSSHRLKLTMIRESEKPCCFKNINVGNLPGWTRNHSRRFCVLLLLDNAPAHPSTSYRWIKGARKKIEFSFFTDDEIIAAVNNERELENDMVTDGGDVENVKFPSHDEIFEAFDSVIM